MNNFEPLKKNYYNEKDAATAFLATVIIFLITSFLLTYVVQAFVLMQSKQEGSENIDTEFLTWANYIVMLISQLSIFSAYLFVNKKSKTNGIKGAALDKGFNPGFLPSSLFIILFMLLTVMPLTVVWEYFLRAINFNLASYETDLGAVMKSPFDFVMIVILMCVLPAIFEELVFRGIVLRGFAASGKRGKAVLLSALAFSLMHMSPLQTIYQFALGILFGYVVLRTDSLYPAMILHFLNNLIAILMNYFDYGVPMIENVLILFIAALPLAIIGIIFSAVIIDLLTENLPNNFFVRWISKLKYESKSKYYASNLWFDGKGAVSENQRFLFNLPVYAGGMYDYGIYQAVKNKMVADNVNRSKRSAGTYFLIAASICATMWLISLVLGVILPTAG